MEPIYSTARLASAVAALADRADDLAVRAQLAALAGIVRNLDADAPEPERRADLERAIDGGIEDEDEAAVCAAMAELAALERRPIHPLDWAAASGG